MQQRKTIRSLSPVRRLKFFLFLYWLHFSETLEAIPPRATTPLALQRLRLTGSLLAITILGFIVMRESIYIGMAIIMAYSTLLAFYAIYSTLRLRLARRQAYWVGE